jgi:hypothetical protein
MDNCTNALVTQFSWQMCPCSFYGWAWGSLAVGHLGLPVGDSNGATQVNFNDRETGSSFYMKELFIGLYQLSIFLYLLEISRFSERKISLILPMFLIISYFDIYLLRQNKRERVIDICTCRAYQQGVPSPMRITRSSVHTRGHRRPQPRRRK